MNQTSDVHIKVNTLTHSRSLKEEDSDEIYLSTQQKIHISRRSVAEQQESNYSKWSIEEDEDGIYNTPQSQIDAAFQLDTKKKELKRSGNGRRLSRYNGNNFVNPDDPQRIPSSNPNISRQEFVIDYTGIAKHEAKRLVIWKCATVVSIAFGIVAVIGVAAYFILQSKGSFHILKNCLFKNIIISISIYLDKYLIG